MSRKFTIQFVGSVVLFASSCVSTAFAQNPLDELYGKGVHAYFSNNHALASELLTQAIDAGSVDPRAYYFRGLTQAMQGGMGAGQADYERGAELEVSGRRTGDIGKALQRIQGAQRLEIEKARQDARVNWRAQQAAMLQMKSEEAMRNGNVAPQLPSVSPFSGDGMLDGKANEMPKNNGNMQKDDLVPATDNNDTEMMDTPPASDDSVDPFKDSTEPEKDPAPSKGDDDIFG